MRLTPVLLTATLCCAAAVASACGTGGDGQGANAGDSALRAATASGPGGAPATSQGVNTGGQSMSDAQIASTVGAINGGEIMSSQLAQRKASSSDVKSYARQMITDHTAMQGKMDSIATAKNITPQSPPTADSLQAAMKTLGDSLGRLGGRAFDRAYMAAQLASHQRSLEMLTRFAGSAQDADMKAALQEGVTKVQQHLDRAREIEGKLPAGS